MPTFSAPIGGIPYSLDFAPSILFAVLYAAIMPLMWHRVLKRKSRSILLIGTAVFSIERIYIYIQRAIQSRNDKARFLSGFITYMQLSFALGFIGIASDMVNMVRCLFVNPTYGSDMYYRSPAATTKGGVYAPPPPGTLDQPKLRRSLRRLTSLLRLEFLAALILGIIAQAYYPSGFNNQKNADISQSLRLTSTIIAISSCVSIIFVVGWSWRRFPQNSKGAAAVASSVAALMAIVGIFRVSVLHIKTTSLREPFPSNDAGVKAAFYIFHSLPEWLAVVIIFGANVRQLFGTGPFGDYRFRDMTEKQKARWEKRQAKKGQQNAAEKGSNLDVELPDEIPLQEKEMSGSETNPSPLVSNV